MLSSIKTSDSELPLVVSSLKKIKQNKIKFSFRKIIE